MKRPLHVNYRSSLVAAFVMLPLFALAQPAGWTPVPTNSSGTLLGTVTVGGNPAQAGDWVAAFDAGGACAGAVEVILNGGDAFVSLPIYGDDATTTETDEGIDGGEAFTLQLWRYATGEILLYPNEESPTEFAGWASTNGAPMPGYDDAFTVYDFAYEGVAVTFECLPDTTCLNGDFVTMVGTPEGGEFAGPGVFFAVFVGYLFDPLQAGLGTHTLTYTYDGVTDSCTVVVASAITPDILIPESWCAGDGPLLLSANPGGGTWTGTGVLGDATGWYFDPAVVAPGTYPITYSVEGDCSGTATTTLTVFPSPEVPTIVPLQGLLYAQNVAEGDSMSWWIDYGMGPVDIEYYESVFYFPSFETTMYVQTTNSYGCSTTSAGFLVDMTIGVSEHLEAELCVWLTFEGLQANAPLAEVSWFDVTGRRIAGPQGAGPWLVWAQAQDGRIVRKFIFAPF